MIPKASQRAGGQQLATHLLNEFDNERVEIAELRGAIAPDLHGAFNEWRAQARATRCRKYLYSLSVNPDPEQRPLSRAEYLDFIERAERKLGLDGQPRAIVFHVKHGREHCHVVWSRIDTDRLRAVQLSHDRPKLQSVVREFARDLGLDVPRGTKDRQRDAAKYLKREDLKEKQQEERTGLTKRDRIEHMTAAWRESRSARELVQALEQRGYFLARGDRRAYVVVDRFGEVFSLPRYIESARTADVVSRLAADFPLERLPDPAGAKEFARKKREAQLVFEREFVRSADERHTALLAAHRQRRSLLDARRDALTQQHHRERDALREAQEDANRGVAATRLIRRPRGMIAFLSRITGIQALINLRQRKEDRQRAAEHKRQTDALARRHQRERDDLERHYRALESVEKRELRSLATALRRDHLLALFHEPARTPDPMILRQIAENARDIGTVQERDDSGTGDTASGGAGSDPHLSERSASQRRPPKPGKPPDRGPGDEQ